MYLYTSNLEALRARLQQPNRSDRKFCHLQPKHSSYSRPELIKNSSMYLPEYMLYVRAVQKVCHVFAEHFGFELHESRSLSFNKNLV